MASSPQELELTLELLAYAKEVALKEAKKHCQRGDSYDDVVQEAVLHLHSKPPKFDPTRGASEKTLIYTVVMRAVIKAAEREAKFRRADRFRQFAEPVEGENEELAAHQVSEKRTVELTRSRWNLDDILRFIDNEKGRSLCQRVIECKGNLSEAARLLGLTEGAVRYRLHMLRPKLLAAGFDPFCAPSSLLLRRT